jgi:hypothetical protein
VGELPVLEGLIVFFIVLPLLRPVFPRLADLDGLLFLPLVAFLCTLAIFPAYGFRPECIPLLLYTFFLAALYLPPVLVRVKLLPPGKVPPKGPGFMLGFTLLLIPVAAAALLFTPSREAGPVPGMVTGEVYTRKIQTSPEGNEFTLRLYGSPGTPGPLMLVVPPLAGSAAAVDQVCRELRERGFTVISYSRKSFDSPPLREDGKQPGTPAALLYRMFRIHSRGFKFQALNERGKALEAERLGDVVFLLSYLREEHPGDPAFSGIPAGQVFIAGYGVGGGALVRLAGSPGFARRNPEVKGIIALESPVFSGFIGEDPPPAPAATGNESRLRSLWAGITRRVLQWRPRKIAGLGVLPRPEVPVLYMVSDKALAPRHREGRYAAVFALLQDAREPALLAALPGAGPLDYSDIPAKFPLYRLFFPGQTYTLGKSRDFPRETAALMTNFAALFADNPQAIGRENLTGNIYIESGGAWNFRNPRDILDL